MKETKRQEGQISKRAERGQATVFVATLVLTFLLFFAFVVNTGLLVHAKINLQNAADLAAYSGAATQARQLTHISYLNYEMRRQYKKFLFRYYVIGNMAQETHPEAPSTNPRRWAPKKNVDPVFGTPSTCIVFNPQDNYCQVTKIGALPTVSGGADPVISALAASYDAIEATKKDTCKALGETNIRALFTWLMNTDPFQEKVDDALKDLKGLTPEQIAKIQQRVSALKTLTLGLGLFPKNMLLNMRINTLAKAMNHPPVKSLNKASADNMKKQTALWFENERTLQAFYSAYHTLGNNLFSDPNSITMEEIAPPMKTDPVTKQDMYYVGIHPQEVAMDLYATDFGFDDGTNKPPNCDVAAANAPRTGGCVPCLRVYVFKKETPTMVPIEIPVGVEKVPEVLTYYAVRLMAKTKLMFSNPLLGGGGELELEAVAAAQPFGSRIGPVMKPKGTVDSLFSTGYPKSNSSTFGSMCGALNITFQCSFREPNLPVKLTDDPNGNYLGWNSEDVEYHYFGNIGVPDQNGYRLPNPLDSSALEKAYQVAMSPTPWEVGNYNIPNDLPNPTEEPFLNHFDAKGVYSIWAPLALASSNGKSVEDQVTQAIKDVQDAMSAPGPNIPPAMKAVTDQMGKAFADGIGYYVSSKLKAGNGEGGEGINIYRFQDPTKSLPTAAGPPQKLSLPPEIIEDNPLKLRTSWDQVLSSKIKNAKRNTYSVKFVPLQLVTQGGGAKAVTTNGTTPFTNKLPASTLGPDVGNVDH